MEKKASATPISVACTYLPVCIYLCRLLSVSVSKCLSDRLSLLSVSSSFIDDSWSPSGPSEIDPHANNDTGLSAADVKDMIAGWSGNMIAVQQKVIAAGAMNWQLFANGGTLAVRPRFLLLVFSC